MTPEEMEQLLSDDKPATRPAQVVYFPKKASTAALRFSIRTWSKGSARGEGPQKKEGVVMVRRNPVKLDETPLDHLGRKLERCPCGEWAPKPPFYCQCMEKCPTCRMWFSTKSAPHRCEERR